MTPCRTEKVDLSQKKHNQKPNHQKNNSTGRVTRKIKKKTRKKTKNINKKSKHKKTKKIKTCIFLSSCCFFCVSLFLLSACCFFVFSLFFPWFWFSSLFFYYYFFVKPYILCVAGLIRLGLHIAQDSSVAGMRDHWRWCWGQVLSPHLKASSQSQIRTHAIHAYFVNKVL